MLTENYLMSVRRVFGPGLLLCPSVAAVILDAQGRILLQEKSGELWSLPAGGIELGETPREAIIREVKEETGCDIVVRNIIDIFGGKAFRYTYPNGHQVEYVVTLFHCEIVRGDDQPADAETKSLKYFSEQEMPRLAIPYPVEALFLKGPYAIIDESRNK